MTRTRVSTTVDGAKLAAARRIRPDVADAVLLDEALAALIAKHRAAEIDAGYAVYDDQPLDQTDEWGSLAEFRAAVSAS
jgi:hypothetical protein